MGDGDINAVSRLLGALEGKLESIDDRLEESSKARHEMRGTIQTLMVNVTALGGRMDEMTAKLQSQAASFEALAQTVKVLENTRQQGLGMKALALGLAGFAGSAGTVLLKKMGVV
jgi:methyl-accepting chemotaxis protein